MRHPTPTSSGTKRRPTTGRTALPSTQQPGAGGELRVPSGAQFCSLVEVGQLQPTAQEEIGRSTPLADALCTAKQITWRGQSELPQMPWPQARPGLVLVVDLWSGISGLLVALLALGVRCIAVAAEQQKDLWPAVQRSFPHLIHVKEVEALRGIDFLPVLKRRQFSTILVGGGSPCQGNSSLNTHRRGLQDQRSQQPREMQRLIRELRQVMKDHNMKIPVVQFLENVGSSPPAVIDAYTKITTGTPVKINADIWGWVNRNRLYWIAGDGKSLTRKTCTDIKLPDGFELTEFRDTGSFEVTRSDRKPWPSRILFEDGYIPAIAPGEPGRRFHVLTREFFHPTDRVSQSSPEATERFFEDHRRFPPSSYERESLVWRQDQWRQLTPSERAQMHGLPPSLVQAISAPTAKERTARQNSAVGNGFHIPSLMLALLIAFQLIPPLDAINLYQQPMELQERELQARVSHTAFDPQVLNSFPGIMVNTELMVNMQTQLSVLDAGHPAWRCVMKIDSCDLRRLQTFWVFCQLKGYDQLEYGPDWAMQKQRAEVRARLGSQRAPGDSKHGLDHLLPPGLGRSAHIEKAKQQLNPFGQDLPLDLDLQFAIQAMLRWGIHMRVWRTYQQQALLRTLAALQPLRDELAKHRSTTSMAVAAERDVAGIAMLTALLRWPDRQQALGYLQGFRVVGEIETSKIFKPIPTTPLDHNFFGQAAIEEVDQAQRAPEPKNADEIYRQTLEEIDKGFTEPLCSAEEVDRRFGKGEWRPIYRFLLHQGDKDRLIDDGRRGGQNDWSAMQETIFTIGLDLVPAMAYHLATLAKELYGALPPWFHLQIGTDDLPDAFRGCPIHPEQQRAAVIAIWVPQDKAWRFGIMQGCPFGLGSVVVTFNRYPTLITAALRRLLGIACAAYFDDNLVMDLEHDATEAKSLLQQVFTLMGTPPKPSKAFPMMNHRGFLGAVVDMAEVHPDGSGEACIAPKDSSRRQVYLDITEALAADSMSTAQAAKTRGRSSWVGTNSFGKLGRLGLSVLKWLQYHRQHKLTSAQRRSLQFHAHIIMAIPPRRISVTRPPEKPVLIYSDAEYTPGSDQLPRLGWVVFPGGDARPVGQTLLLPMQVWKTWSQREQQIFPAEAVALPLGTWSMANHMRNRDIIWFIDNESATSCAIRGGSKVPEVEVAIQVAHLLWLHLGCRVWIEWIDSQSNPSDGLSRLGLEDPWTKSQDWILEVCPEPPWHHHATEPDDIFHALWKTLGQKEGP